MLLRFFVAKAAVHVPFMAFYGRFPAKWIFTGSILIFEIGSLLSALSRSSVMFILGRSVSGIGSSGMSMGAAFIGFTLAPSRSTVWSLLLIAGQMSSVLKPILSGLLVDKVTWRCKFLFFCLRHSVGCVAGALRTLTLPSLINHPMRSRAFQTTNTDCFIL